MRARWLLAVTMVGAVISARAEWAVEVATDRSLRGGGVFFERTLRADDRAVRVTGVLVRAAEARFAVVDNPDGRSLGAAMRAAGAVAGVNGGYFHADGTPLGLVIADGRKLHAFERAKLLSGIFVVTGGRPRLVRSGQYQPAAGDSEALQAGPFLLEAGRPPAGLNAARRAPRTVVATDGAGRWALLLVSPLSLAETGALLAESAGWLGVPLRSALNFDGGSSSGLWAAVEPTAFSAAEFATVRNFLAVFPRR